MRSATLQVHGSANELLSPDRRNQLSAVEFELPVGLRDLIQSTGIPIVELQAVSVNGRTAPISSRIEDGDTIEAWSRYPVEEPLEHPAFVADVHLRRLAHYLRLFGFDTAYQREAEDDLYVDGRWWEDLGEPREIAGGTLVVKLGNATDGYLIADAIRIERLGDLP